MSRRSKRRAKREVADHRDRWMITYADLITLLLIFFVIMYAMSNLDTGKYDVVTQSLQSTFNKSDSILELGDGLGETPGQTITKPPREAQRMIKIRHQIRTKIPLLIATVRSRSEKNNSGLRNRNYKICSM